MSILAESPLAGLVERVASADPAPGAGPSLAWTCSLAAALVEMASGVALRSEPSDDAAERRRDLAAGLRARALELADEDVAAYTAVLAVLRGRGEPGYGGRLREALSQAADPPLAIVALATQVTGLAAEAALVARGGVRGEAITAAVLGESVARAGVHLIDLNLASAPDDARHARVRELAESARADLDTALG
jgi:formiminotetrahydrofolate cyclodeaminase